MVAVEASELSINVTKVPTPTFAERLKSISADMLIAIASPVVQYLASKPGLKDLIELNMEQRSASCGCEITDVPILSKWNSKITA